jgi:signal transduction histidine kinase
MKSPYEPAESAQTTGVGTSFDLTALAGARASLMTLWAQHPSVSQRAVLIGELLRSLWPEARLAACLLGDEERVHAGIFDETGVRRPEWEAILVPELTSRLQGDAEHGEGWIPSPPALLLPNALLAVQVVGLPDQPRGVLALGASTSSPPDGLAVAQALLASFADIMTARLCCEFQGGVRRALAEEGTEYRQRARFGELVGPVLHEFNNFLHVVLMHLTVLETELPENLHGEFAELRRQGHEVNEVVKLLQQYRRSERPSLHAVDVNRVMRQVVNELGKESAVRDGSEAAAVEIDPETNDEPGRKVAVDCSLAAELPPWNGSAVDLTMIGTFLVRNALAAAGGRGRVTVRTEAAAGNLILRVEDTGPSAPAESLPRLFEPTTQARPNTNPLELAACRNLVRRYQGRISAETPAAGGLAIIVKLPVQASESGEERGSAKASRAART